MVDGAGAGARDAARENPRFARSSSRSSRAQPEPPAQPQAPAAGHPGTPPRPWKRPGKHQHTLVLPGRVDWDWDGGPGRQHTSVGPGPSLGCCRRQGTCTTPWGPQSPPVLHQAAASPGCPGSARPGRLRRRQHTFRSQTGRRRRRAARPLEAPWPGQSASRALAAPPPSPGTGCLSWLLARIPRARARPPARPDILCHRPAGQRPRTTTQLASGPRKSHAMGGSARARAVSLPPTLFAIHSLSVWCFSLALFVSPAGSGGVRGCYLSILRRSPRRVRHIPTWCHLRAVSQTSLYKLLAS